MCVTEWGSEGEDGIAASPCARTKTPSHTHPPLTHSQVDKMLAQLRKKMVTKHLVLLDCCPEFSVTDIPCSVHEKFRDKDKASFNVKVGHGTVIGYATSPGDFASDGDCSDKHKGSTGHGKIIFLT